jgi:hypothetical protein
MVSEGSYFYGGQSISSPAVPQASVRGPNCPVPPWSRTVEEPRTPRGFFISANGSASHRISMTHALLLATPEEGRVKAAMFICVSIGIKTRWRSSQCLFPSLASRVHRFALLIGLGILLR